MGEGDVVLVEINDGERATFVTLRKGKSVEIGKRRRVPAETFLGAPFGSRGAKYPPVAKLLPPLPPPFFPLPLPPLAMAMLAGTSLPWWRARACSWVSVTREPFRQFARALARKARKLRCQLGSVEPGVCRPATAVA